MKLKSTALFLVLAIFFKMTVSAAPIKLKTRLKAANTSSADMNWGDVTAVPDDAFIGKSAGSATYSGDDSTCVMSRFPMSLTSPGTHGAAQIENKILYEDTCLQDLNQQTLVYNWTDESAALTDFVGILVAAPAPLGNIPFQTTIRRLALNVNSIDLVNGIADLNVSAGKDDSGGTVTLEFIPTSGAHVVMSLPEEFAPSTSVLVQFDPTALANNSYSSVLVTWNAQIGRLDDSRPNGYTIHQYAVSKLYTLTGSKKDSGCDCEASVDDSVNVSTGNVSDYEADGATLEDFVFQRVYNSQNAGAGILGNGWTAMGDKNVVLLSSTPRIAVVKRQDGKAFTFREQGLPGSTLPWVGDADSQSSLYASYAGADATPTGWTYYTEDNHLEMFDSTGEILSDSTSSGRTLTYGYDASDRLSSVTDFKLRQLRFGYDANGFLNLLTQPDGTTIQYVVDPVTRTLTDVYYEDPSDHARYGYNEAAHTGNVNLPGFLTSKTDESGATAAVWNYNPNGKASSGQRTGFGQVTLSYDSPNQTTYTDEGGQSRVLGISILNGRTKITSGNLPRYDMGLSPFTSQIFDSSGNVSTKVDFDGNRVCMSHSSRNLETVRIEGLSSTVACPANLDSYAVAPSTTIRKISTQWHPDWRLPTAKAEPKKITHWYYNGQPDPSQPGMKFNCAGNAKLPDGKPVAVLCKVVEQATTDVNGTLEWGATSSGVARTWSFTYDANGQLLTAVDPLAHTAVTHVYYTDASYSNGVGHSKGDLYTTTSAVALTTTFNAYDRRGHVLQSTDANGTVTARTYWPRGWLKSVTLTPPSGGGAAQQMQYFYDAHGDLQSFTQPDGVVLTFGYDLAHRLTDMTDSAGNHVHYGLDNSGNRVSEQVSDASGQLTSLVARVFDTLGRVQSVTGAAQ